jgi:hypothetical protein
MEPSAQLANIGPRPPQVRHLAEHTPQLPQWRQWRPSLLAEEASYAASASTSGQVGPMSACGPAL